MWLLVDRVELLFDYTRYKTNIHWHSTDPDILEIVAILLLVFLGLQAASTLMMCNSDQFFFLLSESQDQKSLMHRWRSIPGCVNKRVTIVFTYENCHYKHVGRMWLCSHLFAENVTPKVVETPLTLNSMTYLQLVDAHQVYANMHTVIIGSQ